MNPPDIQAALNPVIDAFEALGIRGRWLGERRVSLKTL
jgi:hypothetical protein